MNDNLLDVKNLSVIFNTDGGRICALRDLSLFVKRGEILAVVGESGCGKSVLCKTIMGLLPRIAEITSGQILINGTDVAQLTDQEHCAIRGVDISMVFQDPMTSLDPTYTIGAQIVESIRVHDKTVSKETAKAKAIELMETVGIERAAERFDAYPWMLSGGMRQRCVLAMALSQEPALLIADEPTTALDVTVQSEILDLLLKIRDEKGMSILFITHDLGVVARIADRVAIMYAESTRTQYIRIHGAFCMPFQLLQKTANCSRFPAILRTSLKDLRRMPMRCETNTPYESITNKNRRFFLFYLRTKLRRGLPTHVHQRSSLVQTVKAQRRMRCNQM